MFKDSTKKLVQLPAQTDSYLYLGAEYMSTIRALKTGILCATSHKSPNKHVYFFFLSLALMFSLCGVLSSAGTTSVSASSPIKWCAVGNTEASKCDTWSINSMTGDANVIECQFAPTVDDCLKMIMVNRVKSPPLYFAESALRLRIYRLPHPAARGGRCHGSRRRTGVHSWKVRSGSCNGGAV